jgi:peroxiredoxin
LKRLKDWVGKSKNQVRPLAALVQLLWRQGNKDEAKRSFESLREISGSIDLDVPPFARLQPIAMELGFKADWRLPKPVARNAAELPDLATLGPLTWKPADAPGWSLPDSAGQLHAATEFQGRPVVAIFYLGSGCLHCAEQLKAFASKQKQYADAGISLVAISTDSVENLKKSQDRYNTEGVFPFQLVSDPTLETFKRFHAYDDFESTPLHATVLIDALGKIRWHDLGPEPFMDVDFVLAEARRLIEPTKVEFPREPELLDLSHPADALAPRNVFPVPTQTPAKEPVRNEVAAGPKP